MGLLHPLIEAGRTLLLRNPSNPLRTLSPKIFDQWLDDTFGELIINKDKQRDPDAHQVKKGNAWYFGYKAHVGVDKYTGPHVKTISEKIIVNRYSDFGCA